jgi:hypothetical protein
VLPAAAARRRQVGVFVQTSCPCIVENIRFQLDVFIVEESRDRLFLSILSLQRVLRVVIRRWISRISGCWTIVTDLQEVCVVVVLSN